MTKPEAISMLRMQRDNVRNGNAYDLRSVVEAVTTCLLADDEPAKTVDTSLRGWVIMDDITPYFAREVGLFRGKMRGQVQWTWDEVVNDLEDSTIRKLTPADLEVTE